MIAVEFAKQFERLRTYVLLGLVVALPVFLTIVFKARGAPSHGGGPGQEFLGLATDSGVNMALVSLGHVGPLVLPVVGAIFAGSAVAEEANWRTLGYLLVRPVGRSKLLAAKLAVVVTLVAIATLLAALVAVVAGVLAFGWDPVTTKSGVTISAQTGLARVAIAAPYIAWSLAGVLAIAFFVSTLSDAPLNAVAVAVGLVIVSQLVDSVSAIGAVRDVLPTHYWSAWEDLFAEPVSWRDMAIGFIAQLPYVVGSLVTTWWLFNKKDILT